MSAVSDDGVTVAPTSRFVEALARIRGVVGDEHVLERWDEIEPRARDTLPAVRAPSALVYPANADEVRAVVSIAHACKLPLWPISRGRNWTYGAATPNVDGMVVLSLERLNRIIEVHEELAYAVVEPGVTFAQLQAHLEQNGIGLWIDPTDSSPHGSIIGNALDRGLGLGLYGDHFGNLCGMDVVLPDGQVIQTPGGGGPASRIRHVYKWGTGPYLDGLFSQAGLGVVVKSGVWLMPKPAAYCFYALDVLRDEDAPKVVDACRRLVLSESVRTRILLVNDFGRLTLVTRCPFPPHAERTYLSDAELAALCRRHGVPRWMLSGGLYGTQAEVKAQQRLLERALGQYGRLRFIDERRMQQGQSLVHGLKRLRRLPLLSRPAERLVRRLTGKSVEVIESMPHAFDRPRGRSTEHFLRPAYYKAPRPAPDSDVDPARDGGGLIWIAPSLPFTGRDFSTVLDLCRPLYREYGFDFVSGLMQHSARAVSLVMGILYYREDPDEAARAEALYVRIREEAAAAGYPLYRMSTIHQGVTHIDAPVFQDVANRIKQALDPDGIIAPGRYGVGQPPA